MIPTDGISEHLPPGLVFRPEFVTRAEERRLIALCGECGLSVLPYDEEDARSSRSFGWQYDMATDRFAPCEAMPQGFHRLRDAAAEVAGVAPASLEQCLLNRYEAGATIPPHVDKPFWDVVIGLSLGAPASMVFTLPEGEEGGEVGTTTLRVNLPPRSLYVLTGPAREVWHHAIADVGAVRWSVTLRNRALP